MHTPEFAFEHVLGNVRKATRELDVTWPVALDNKYATWNAYSNQYWPAEYFVDRSGHVRRAHFGEGEYDKSEQLIRILLGKGVPKRTTDVADATPTGLLSPETYLGTYRLDPARYVGERHVEWWPDVRGHVGDGGRREPPGAHHQHEHLERVGERSLDRTGTSSRCSAPVP